MTATFPPPTRPTRDDALRGAKAVGFCSMHISVIADVKPVLGDGPLWDVAGQRLYRISLGRRVFRCTEHGAEMRARAVPSRFGAKALRARGGAVVALVDGFHALVPDTADVTPLVMLADPAPGKALNDGKFGPAGRFAGCSMDLGETGTLWQLGPNCHWRLRTGGSSLEALTKGDVNAVKRYGIMVYGIYLH